MDDYRRSLLIYTQNEVRNSFQHSICMAFARVYRREGLTHGIPNWEFCYPEIRKALPKKQTNKLFWWPTNDLQSRLDFLQTLIDNG